MVNEPSEEEIQNNLREHLKIWVDLQGKCSLLWHVWSEWADQMRPSVNDDRVLESQEKMIGQLDALAQDQEKLITFIAKELVIFPPYKKNKPQQDMTLDVENRMGRVSAMGQCIDEMTDMVFAMVDAPEIELWTQIRDGIEEFLEEMEDRAEQAGVPMDVWENWCSEEYDILYNTDPKDILETEVVDMEMETVATLMLNPRLRQYKYLCDSDVKTEAAWRELIRQVVRAEWFAEGELRRMKDVFLKDPQQKLAWHHDRKSSTH
jgi:hypothetical protein